MKKLTTLITLIFLVTLSQAQTQNDLATLTARICQTDSIRSTLGVYNEDSIVVFNYQTPNYETYGAPSFEYEKFDLVFDVSSNLLFNAIPFGKIDIIEFGKKSARIVIELAGAGNREAEGKWTFAVYDFVRSKGAPWQLQGVKYHFDDYYVGKKID